MGVPASGSANVGLEIRLDLNAPNDTAPTGCENQSFTFSFNGTATYNATTATSTTLASAPNPSNFGQAVVFTATVTSTPNAAGQGTMTFYDSSVVISPPEPVTSTGTTTGTSTFTTSSLAPGSHPIYAVFTPTDPSSFSSSTSNTVTQVVGFSQSCITTTSWSRVS